MFDSKVLTCRSLFQKVSQFAHWDFIVKMSCDFKNLFKIFYFAQNSEQSEVHHTIFKMYLTTPENPRK